MRSILGPLYSGILNLTSNSYVTNVTFLVRMPERQDKKNPSPRLFDRLASGIAQRIQVQGWTASTVSL